MSRNAVDDAPLSAFHKRLALYSAGGPFLDGYILSIIGVAMVQISPQLQLSAVWEGLLGASALIGIFIGGGLGGYLSDILGRQTLYTIDLIAIVVCSVLQFFVSDVATLFLLRLGIGIAVGADYPIATSLLAEFTPRKFRGPLLGGLVVMFFVGATAAYFIGDALVAVGDDAWRWMLLSPAIPATIIALLRLGTPESPRWLLSKGRREQADAVMREVYGDGASVDDLPPDSESVKLSALLRGGYLGRIAFVTTFWTCAVVPLFAMYAFGPKVLAALDIASETANTSSALISLLFLIGCVLAMVIINRTGRRRLLIWSFLISGVGLLVVGFAPTAPLAVLAAAFLVYALGLGGSQILQWIYPNELFPTEVRGTAVGVASSLSRIGAALGTYLVPLALTGLGVGPTMLIGAGITLLGVIVSVLWAPETTNLALHECGAVEATRTESPTGQPLIPPARSTADPTNTNGGRRREPPATTGWGSVPPSAFQRERKFMPQQVRGGVFHAKGDPVTIATINVPDPARGEAVGGCGVCHTDLHYREGDINDEFPFLIGHETAGIIEAVAKVSLSVFHLAWEGCAGRVPGCGDR